MPCPYPLTAVHGPSLSYRFITCSAYATNPLTCFPAAACYYANTLPTHSFTAYPPYPHRTPDTTFQRKGDAAQPHRTHIPIPFSCRLYTYLQHATYAFWLWITLGHAFPARRFVPHILPYAAPHSTAHLRACVLPPFPHGYRGGHYIPHCADSPPSVSMPTAATFTCIHCNCCSIGGTTGYNYLGLS